MTVSKKNSYKETFKSFVLSPVVVAVLLAAFNPSVNAQTISNYEYLGKWSANPLSPNNPYLDGELIERDSTGAVTGTSDFSKATCTTYVLRKDKTGHFCGQAPLLKSGLSSQTIKKWLNSMA